MNKLDRAGIFKARPIAMGLQVSEESQSVAVWIEFHIMAQLDGTEWQDWTAYEDHSITGYFYIVKRDGTVNETTVAQLAQAIDWDGNPATISDPPPDVPVQITVKEDTYQGRTSLKVGWINPGDFVPRAQTVSPEQVTQLQTRFGSLLRAAAGAARRPKTTGKPAPEAAPARVQETIPYTGQFDPDSREDEKS